MTWLAHIKNLSLFNGVGLQIVDLCSFINSFYSSVADYNVFILS